MPKREKKAKTAMERLDRVRHHPLRRQIIEVAQEEEACGGFVTPKGLGERLTASLSNTSYHVKCLIEEEALIPAGTEPKRGAVSHRYKLNPEFMAEIGDSIALDQITELIDDARGPGLSQPIRAKLVKLIRTTGRPVEA